MPDKYFLADLILTFTLLFLAIFLVKEALPVYWLYLIFIILICSFCFSRFIKDKQNRLIRFLITGATFATLLWMINSILNSSFLYKDVIIICIRGAIFLELLLSLNVYWTKYLAYMRALNVPLFMCFPLFIKGYNEILIIPILGYFTCWLVALKVQFYEFLREPIDQINFRSNHSAMLLAVIFIISLFISGVLFFKLPLRKVLKGGIFFHYLDMDTSQDILEKEYYDLQEKLEKKITELITEFGSAEDGYSVLNWLSYLIKEPSVILEVDRALQGLVSYLNRPGLGLEEGEGKDTLVILKNFVDRKATFALRRIIDEIKDTLKKNRFHIKTRIAITELANKLQNSNSLAQALEHEKWLKELIDNSSLDSSVKKELKELVKQLKEWKVFELGHHKIYFEDKLLGKKEIEEVLIEQAASLAKEYPQTPEKYPQIKKPSLNIGVALDLPIKITLKWAFGLILCVPILFLVLYFLTQKQKNKLLSLCKDPREFIMSLYENAKNILIIFGLKYEGFLVPLFYAELVEQKYSIKNNLFLKFTAKFEEAKYSKHTLQFEDANSVLDDYNNFLKVLFSRYNKFSLGLRYCLALLQRRPLRIPKSYLLSRSEMV